MRHLAGRVAELDLLAELLKSSTDTIGATLVTTIVGTAGVGKTALAVWWAHHVSGQFPDGQLYVDLRGFGPGASPTTVEQAVRGFLDAFEVPPDRVPVSMESQVGLYRSLVAGRRVLVVLDNAHDANQVRWLLPGSPGCVALVTSRNELGVVAVDGAHQMVLDLLSRDEARQLLVQRLGGGRVSVEPEAVDEIIAGCARLPLALAVAAARAAAQPTFSLAVLARQLREAGNQLDVLAAGDAVSDVRAVLSWSYQALSSDTARVFRLLGLHPGPDIGAPAAASLAGVPVAQIMPVLEELLRANLLVEHTTGRFILHALLRASARNLARTHDSDSDRWAAQVRILDHYLHTAHTAAGLLAPYRGAITMPSRRPGVTPEDLADYETALAWFSDEWPVVQAAVEVAAEAGLHIHTWQLAWTLTTFYYLRGHWHDWVAVQTLTLRAAQRLQDRPGQVRAHRQVASGYLRLGRHDDAIAHLRQALDLLAELGDATGSAGTHYNFAWALDLAGQHRQALHHARKALAIYRASGDELSEAEGLNPSVPRLSEAGFDPEISS